MEEDKIQRIGWWLIGIAVLLIVIVQAPKFLPNSIGAIPAIFLILLSAALLILWVLLPVAVFDIKRNLKRIESILSQIENNTQK
jgi:vacuolar-type H+-ATPase subunit I/STV1